MTAVSRFRAPHKVHVLSWALALEREGSVSCHFKDCQFMALSVEEMGNHYPFCTCENSKYSFVCEICSRRTDALEKLVLHKIYSHSYKPTDEESEKITHFQNLPIKKEITPILKRSWEIFLEKKKYLKCLLRPCLYVTSSMEDMENHYLSFCKEEFWHLLKYVCEFCYGRVTNVIDLDIHIKTAHESKTYLIANTIVPDNNINCVELWSRDILIHKQGKCFVEGCRFVDNNVKILEKHYASCNGKKKNVVVCCACGCWLQNENRLNEHRRCFHKDLDDSFFSNSSQDKDSDNRKFLLFDEISPNENDPLSEIKKIKREESIFEKPPEAEIPIIYLKHDHRIWTPEKDVLLEDPLASHSSSSTEAFELSISEDNVNNKYLIKFSSPPPFIKIRTCKTDIKQERKVGIQESSPLRQRHSYQLRKRMNTLRK